VGHGGDVISCFEQCDNTQVNNVMCNLYNLGFWMIRFTTTFAALFPWGPNRILAISSPTKIINIVQSIMVLRCFGDPLCEEHRKSCGIQLPCQKKRLHSSSTHLLQNFEQLILLPRAMLWGSVHRRCCPRGPG